ncbi:MAG: calcium-binding protein [Azonexus sp.]
MNTMSDFSKQSDLALAAYAELYSGISGAAFRNALKDVGMSPAQAEHFSTQWRVVDSKTFPNGAAATVFEEIGKPGMRYLAVRGTELGIADIVADAILATGFPSSVNPQFFTLRTQVQEWIDSGALTANFSVTGHSLGGYLAAGIGSWFQNGTVFMYNAPGIGGVVGSAYEALKTALGLGSQALASNIFNFRGSEGISVITGLGAQLAPPWPIQIEAAPGGIFGPGNHSVVRLADAFSIYALYAALAPSLAPEQIGSILKSASNQNELTLERSLDALRTLLLGKAAVDTAPTKEGGTDNRESFYSNLYTLQSSPEYRALAGSATLRVLSASAASSLSSLAKSDFGALVSLNYLLPISIEGSSGVLGTVHTELYAQWQSDQALTAEQRAKGQANYTDQYLTDRAAFLSGVIDANIKDTGSGKSLRTDTGGEAIYFEDKATGLTLQTQNSGSGQGTSGPNYLFGGTDNDTLFGADEADHLYGGAGMDHLDGGKGSDYIEGNADSDAITGGKGNDTLIGGKGLDTYTFKSGDGWDTIVDSDGLGALYYDDIQLTGGQAVGDSGMVWQTILNKGTSAEKTFTYLLTDWIEGGETYKRLSIEGPAGGMFIKRWQPGQLGIDLPGAQPVVKQPAVFQKAGGQGILFGGGDTDNEITGGIANDVIAGGAGQDKLDGGKGQDVLFGDMTVYEINVKDNWSLSVRPDDTYDIQNWSYVEGGAMVKVSLSGQPSLYSSEIGIGDDDILKGGEGNDNLHGGGGNDLLEGGDNDDKLYGGRGQDVLLGQLGNDTLEGGRGSDILQGGIGHDLLHGEDGYANRETFNDGQTFIARDDGDDQLEGGDGNDTLVGMGGADILQGGNDNDELNGDDGEATPGEFHGNDLLYGGDGNDKLWGNGAADFLDGGVGDDELYGDDVSAASLPYHGSDTLRGGIGNDLLSGGGRADVLDGGDGNDYLMGDASISQLDGQYHGNDTLDGGIGDDILIGNGGNDFLTGGTGDDALRGDASDVEAMPLAYQGNDYLDGGVGADDLAGGGGDDTLLGGSGADALDGGAGNDLYLIGPADAPTSSGLLDTIYDSAGADRLKLDVAASALRLSKDNGNLRLYWSSDTQGVIVAGGMSGAVETFTLADQQLKWTSLINRYLKQTTTQTSSTSGSTMAGGAFADSLSNSGGNGAFYGGLGNDTIVGSGGGNTYVFLAGDGNDNITNSDTGLAGVDRLQFDDLSASNIRLSQQGQNLLFHVKSTGESVTVNNYFGGAAYEIDQVVFADLVVWDKAQTLAVLNDLANLTFNGTDNTDTLSGDDGNERFFSGDGDDSIAGGVGDDLLDGGSGDDTLEGGVGSDTYVFARGGGHDLISNYDYSEGRFDTLVLSGLNEADIRLENWDGRDLAFVIKATGESVAINAFFYGNPDYQIDSVQFANNVIWDKAKILAMAAAAPPLAPLNGTAGADVLTGGGGNDSLSGAGGNDQLIGDFGADTLNGGSGVDTLIGGKGDDTYVIDSVGDMAIEVANQGMDTVNSGISYALGANLEALTLTGSSNTNGFGNALENSILGNLGNNILDGGKGRDGLWGGAGDDIYRFARGYGQDGISDDSGYDIIEFGPEIRPQNIRLVQRYDSLDIFFDGTGDELSINGYFGQFPIEEIRFADGTVWDTATVGAIIANAGNPIDISDTTSDDSYLVGTPGDDVISSYQGNDTLDGGAGRDRLLGNLNGGNNTYVFSRGYGWDEIVDHGSFGTLDLRGINDSEVRVEKWFDRDLAFTIKDTGESICIWRYFATNTEYNYKIEQVKFANGVVWSQDDFERMADMVPVNQAPVLSNAIQDQATLAWEQFSFAVPAGTFRDPENDLLIYRASLVDGNPLPSWLDFDFATRTFSGTPPTAGTVSIRLEVQDSAGLAASDVFEIVVNPAPSLSLVGTSGNDVMLGGNGNDTLDGGLGNDTMSGGRGDDEYFVDSASDIVTEKASEGTDTVRSSVTLTLANNVENLLLTGSSSINGTGNTLNNVITGNGVANILSGGAGADTMIGGAGNDTYVIDNAGDFVTEFTNEGTDLVQSSVTYTLSANVENLTLTGTTAVSGTGNALDNVLTGNTAANTLTGNAGNDTLNGGTGADTMVGGVGHDTYVVDNTSDVITELAAEGTDLVQSSVTYTLSTNVENLTLTGTTAIKGTGNSLDNILIGNSAANTLTGGDGNDTINGGSGNDTMVGGLGDDTYVVNVSTDVVTEAAGAGNDSIQSAVTLTLTTNVENLVLTGTSAINGTGNTLSNLLRGNTAANTLNGSTGNDILEGAEGNDTLTDTSGTALFNGGAGTDTMTGGASAEIFLGGLGNDTYTTAGGNDIILFNKGDGQDTFATGGTGSDTLSLGGAGLSYADLTFTKSTNDLVLKLGTTDQITFKNWYAATPSKPVTKLQVMAEAIAGFVQGGSDPLKNQKVENFNFTSLVGAFDTARTANPSLSSWALTNALANFQLAGSDTAAMGGDLAYQYGKNGTLAGIGVTPALSTLSDTNLGTNPQALNSLASLQTGTVRLS